MFDPTSRAKSNLVIIFSHIPSLVTDKFYDITIAFSFEC